MRFSAPLTSRTFRSPGRRAAASTQSPSLLPVSLVMNSDSPPRTLRMRPFLSPPSILDSRVTPPAMAIMAPDSTLICSPAPIWARTTAKEGLWRIESCMGLLWVAGRPTIQAAVGAVL